MKIVLIATMFVNSDMIQQTIEFPTLSECLKQQYYEGQLLEKLSEKVITGFEVSCKQVTAANKTK